MSSRGRVVVVLREFDDAAKLKGWQEDWSAASKQTVVKVVYNRDAGELRISLRVKGGSTIEKVISAKDEQGLTRALTEAGAFIAEQLR